MPDVIGLLKQRARILHRQAEAGDPATLAKLRRLPDFKDESPEAIAAGVRRRHCLAFLARALGFAGWPQAPPVLNGQPSGDYGTVLYAPDCDVHINLWCATYEEARRLHAEHGGYLLAYRRQFLVVERSFIETLGLDPDDADWDALERDWVRPDGGEVRRRLYGKLLALRDPL